jgi:hypothetical protein
LEVRDFDFLCAWLIVFLAGQSESTHQPICCSLHCTTHPPAIGSASCAHPRVVFLFVGVDPRGQ